jgi:hypothetical protein
MVAPKACYVPVVTGAQSICLVAHSWTLTDSMFIARAVFGGRTGTFLMVKRLLSPLLGYSCFLYNGLMKNALNKLRNKAKLQ